MLALQKAKTPMAMLAHAAKLRPDFFSPELPAIAEFSRSGSLKLDNLYFQRRSLTHASGKFVS